MDKSEFRNGRKVGAVKAAINMYGGGKANKVTNKPQNDASSNFEEKTSKASELHLAKNRINQIKEDRITVESEKSGAEFELLKAKKLVRKLKLQIEGSKLRTKEYKKGARVEEQLAQEENDQYEEVARELEVVKRELSKIKLEIECALGEKVRAEKEADAAESRLKSYTRTVEKIWGEIEEANEEEVLVQLAEIQARKELAEIEAQRKEERERQLFLIEETRQKISVLRNEVEAMKEVKSLLELTNRDVEVLQYELNLIKEMDYKIQRSQRMKKSGLQSVTKDLEGAKKELEVIKKGGIQLMGSMDVIRNELINITSEKSKIEKMEAEKENSIKKLNLKLLKANDKLEVARASEEEAKLMLPSFSITLEKLKKEKEEARKEEEQLKEETNNIRAEIQKIESETDATEKRVETAIEKLEAVRSVEANSLAKLQALAEKVVRERASKKDSTITISKFEYEYLTGCAAGAQEIADKKVAAANAWVKALMADEKEMKMKTAVAERNIEELKLKEEEEVHRMEKAKNEAELGAEDLQKRRSIKNRDYSLTPVRQAKFRRSIGSPGTRRLSASTSFNIKRRRKAMLRSAKYFANDQIENEKSVPLKEDTDN